MAFLSTTRNYTTYGDTTHDEQLPGRLTSCDVRQSYSIHRLTVYFLSCPLYEQMEYPCCGITLGMRCSVNSLGAGRLFFRTSIVSVESASEVLLPKSEPTGIGQSRDGCKVCVGAFGAAGGTSQSDSRSRHLVAMGRLVPQKGFDILIDAIAPVLENHRDWSLHILGDGPEREHLQSMVDRHRLGGLIKLVGNVRDPERWLRNARILVLSSQYEGYPSALIECFGPRRGMCHVRLPHGTGGNSHARQDRPSCAGRR